MGDGYIAADREIRRSGLASAQEAERVRGVLRDVREAFVAAGRPMGDDQYGAEMEKRFPVMRDGVIDAFAAYIDELEGVGGGLRVTAANYRAAERPGP
ncbi:hypothetical protein [Nonomuraea cavernae]|uniref:Uncharacterized protein n=1 Tax=Nonomuraea cavernae TaxID=2045107 RepID=A0A917Z9F9_9ACTN|nr:hypothetical protein [Nonomuraea cavernae]MCA2189259.1 hypothetical protein [Nonomuraea cavernae]GGO76566.1 hypothetical protein GCM10012289_54200 [Nonomuraea cavernae]